MSSRLIRFIAWWEIACGSAGIAMFAALYLGILQNSRALLDMMGPINYYAGVAFFSFVIAAGRALLKKSTWGLGASCLCQAVQVVWFRFLGGPHVQIQAGPIAGFKIASNYVGLTLGFDSSFFLGTQVSGSEFQVTVNVLAAVWALLLLRAWRKANRATGPGSGLTSA
jgi:hypothetical protein